MRVCIQVQATTERGIGERERPTERERDKAHAQRGRDCRHVVITCAVIASRRGRKAKKAFKLKFDPFHVHFPHFYGLCRTKGEDSQGGKCVRLGVITKKKKKKKDKSSLITKNQITNLSIIIGFMFG